MIIGKGEYLISPTDESGEIPGHVLVTQNENSCKIAKRIHIVNNCTAFLAVYERESPCDDVMYLLDVNKLEVTP